MLDIFKTFSTVEALETEGVWKEYGTARFLIARNRNDNYMNMYTDLTTKHGDELRAGTEASQKLSEELMLEVMSKTVLLGWENVSFKGNEPLKYTHENAVKLLRIKDFFAVVIAWSNNIANFQEAEEKADLKN